MTDGLALRLREWAKAEHPDWEWWMAPHHGPERGVYVRVGPAQAWGPTTNEAINRLADQLAEFGWPDDRPER